MSTITLKNVILAGYPSLFTKGEYNGVTDSKYKGRFVLSKKNPEHVASMAKIEAEISKIYSATKTNKDSFNTAKFCVKDESKFIVDSWEVSASLNKRPIVMGRDLTPITEGDDLITPGCIVNVIISLYYFDKYGKQLSANMHKVQYVGPGEPLGAPEPTIDEDFMDLDL